MHLAREYPAYRDLVHLLYKLSINKAEQVLVHVDLAEEYMRMVAEDIEADEARRLGECYGSIFGR